MIERNNDVRMKGPQKKITAKAKTENEKCMRGLENFSTQDRWLTHDRMLVVMVVLGL